MRESAARRDPATYVGKGLTGPEISAIQRRYWSRLSAEEKSARLATFIASGQKYNKKASRTRIEETTASALAELGAQFARNVQVGRYNVDFLIEPRIILECFGDFWHCNPLLYSPDDFNGALHCTAAEKWERDRARIRALTAAGYVVHILWERDILGDRASLARALRKII